VPSIGTEKPNLFFLFFHSFIRLRMHEKALNWACTLVLNAKIKHCYCKMPWWTRLNRSYYYYCYYYCAKEGIQLNNKIHFFRRCEGKQTCSLDSNNKFGDPCKGTDKYTDIYYQCVPQSNHFLIAFFSIQDFFIISLINSALSTLSIMRTMQPIYNDHWCFLDTLFIMAYVFRPGGWLLYTSLTI
jgi:hypothetical protein